MFLVESLTQPEESRVHSDVCGICCEEPKNSYRLQSCFHRFCIQCMQSFIRSVLGDASQFPIKCPHCSQLIIVEDLLLILDKTQWQKVDTLGINRFMSDNSDTMAFCYTAGCKQINFFNGPVFNCDICKFSYCNKCKVAICLFSKSFTLDSTATKPFKFAKLMPTSTNIWLKMVSENAPMATAECQWSRLTVATRCCAHAAVRACALSAHPNK
jgi:hypothetical protein